MPARMSNGQQSIEWRSRLEEYVVTVVCCFLFCELLEDVDRDGDGQDQAQGRGAHESPREENHYM